MSSAADIDIDEFNAALSRYPALIKSLSKSPKPGVATLEELDHFRYVEAPQRFSVASMLGGSGGEVMDLKDLQKLVDWKLRHGKFRPTLPKLVASNSSQKVQEITKAGFELYKKQGHGISDSINKLSELKGVGPATASLLLSVHDRRKIVFFSDELYKWLLPENAKPKYNTKEYVELLEQARLLITKLKTTAVDLEKVAFVLIKEAEPAPEPKKPKPEPSGRPRGRPSLPESEKKQKPAPSGLPRGRPRKSESAKEEESSPKPRGRPAKAKVEKEEPETPGEGTKKKRGRPSVGSKEIETPASKKSSAKKTKEAADQQEDTPGRRTKKTKL